MEGRYRDQPYRVEEREGEAESAEEDGEASSDVFDGEGTFATSFRDAGEDHRGDGEVHDDESVCPVEDIPQGSAPNADGGAENHNDRGCACYSALQKKAEDRRGEHRGERSWREHRNRRDRPPLLLRIAKAMFTV